MFFLCLKSGWESFSIRRACVTRVSWLSDFLRFLEKRQCDIIIISLSHDMDWTKIYSTDAIVTRKTQYNQSFNLRIPYSQPDLSWAAQTPSRTWAWQPRLPAGLELDSSDSQPDLSLTTQTPSRTWAEQPKLPARQPTDRIKLKETNLNNWDNYL